MLNYADEIARAIWAASDKKRGITRTWEDTPETERQYWQLLGEAAWRRLEEL